MWSEALVFWASWSHLVTPVDLAGRAIRHAANTFAHQGGSGWGSGCEIVYCRGVVWTIRLGMGTVLMDANLLVTRGWGLTRCNSWTRSAAVGYSLVTHNHHMHSVLVASLPAYLLGTPAAAPCHCTADKLLLHHNKSFWSFLS